MTDNSKTTKITAVSLAALIIIGGILFWKMSREDEETGTADLADLLASRSERNADTDGFIVSGESAFTALAVTPAACYYSQNGSRTVPLLVDVEQPDSVLDPLSRFYDAYLPESVTLVGKVDDRGYGVNRKIDIRCPATASREIAKMFWSSSDGAVLVQKDVAGYEEALWMGPLASYVNIPIIVAEELDSDTRDVLRDLGVKYTITCGDIKGYGDVLEITDMESTHDLTVSYMREGLGMEPRYIVLANPLDSEMPPALESIHEDFQGEVFHVSSTGAYAGLEEMSKGVDFEMEIPDEYSNSIMRLRLSYKPHEQDEVDGERIYVFVLWHDENDQKVQKCYFGTPAGYKENDKEIVEFDVPVLNATGKYTMHVEGRMTYEGIPIPHVSEKPVQFQLSVSVDNLASPIYPLMEKISSLAPYLAAHRQGLVMAKASYALQYPGYSGCEACGEPTTNEESIESANKQAVMIHNQLNGLLARLGGFDEAKVNSDKGELVAMADHYYENPVDIGIVADTNMIPHYYHAGGHSSSEGFGQAGDIIYANIDMDVADPKLDYGEGVVSAEYPDIELPVGRICGWDAKDVSSTIARTIFYYDIIDRVLPYSADPDGVWKNNAYAFLGSKIPVETMYGTLIDHVVNLYTEAGFTDVRHTTEEASDIKLTSQFQEGSNYVIGGVHGNYYWYVPACRWDSTAGGSAYDVTNTRELAFGPGTFFLVSCITGRIDGLNPRNALAMTYMHCGLNAYVGATRSTLGWIDPDLDFDMRFLEPEGAVLLSEMFLEEMLNDHTTGIALRNAKNRYLPEDISSGAIKAESYIMFQHYVLHGDPAFNPYEPANA